MSGNSQFAVAIHVLAVLGVLHEHGETRISSPIIAKSVNTNPVVIRNLVALLKQAGLVASKEGKGGGLYLAKAPAQISLLEVYTAVSENEVLLGLNPRSEFKPCLVSCGMKKVLPLIFADVETAVKKSLKGHTLKSVMAQLVQS